MSPIDIGTGTPCILSDTWHVAMIIIALIDGYDAIKSQSTSSLPFLTICGHESNRKKDLPISTQQDQLGT